MLAVVAVALCLQSDGVPLKERLKDPAQVFPAFQELVRRGDLGKAHQLLSANAKRAIPYEALVIAVTSFEASRRLVDSMRVHRTDAATGTLKLCSPDFGLSREVRIVKFAGLWVLDLTPDDLELLKGRTLGWFRHQVRRADGWHFAYPPDWTYAPVARNCDCGR